MGRNYLAHAQGDATNAILAAAGYNSSLLLKWLRAFLADDPRAADPPEAARRLTGRLFTIDALRCGPDGLRLGSG